MLPTGPSGAKLTSTFAARDNATYKVRLWLLPRLVVRGSIRLDTLVRTAPCSCTHDQEVIVTNARVVRHYDALAHLARLHPCVVPWMTPPTLLPYTWYIHLQWTSWRRAGPPGARLSCTTHAANKYAANTHAHPHAQDELGNALADLLQLAPCCHAHHTLLKHTRNARTRRTSWATRW